MQENCYNKMTSVRKSYKRNILAFDKESKTKHIYIHIYMTLGFKYFLCLNGKFFDFKKT